MVYNNLQSIITKILEKLPDWFFHAAGIVLLLGIGLFLYYTIFGTRKLASIFSGVVKLDEKIDKLNTELKEQKEKAVNFEAEAEQLKTACHNIVPVMELLLKIRTEDDPKVKMGECGTVIQKCLDTLASDIKTKAGGMHRCGLWVKQDESLCLAVASSGFPKNYVGNRVLHIDRSIAGRCLRRRQFINLDDVTTDSDWEKNEESKSKYKSLICVPISDWLVLTIDGYQPLNESIQLLSELYATILEAITHEQLEALMSFDEYPSDLFELDTTAEVS